MLHCPVLGSTPCPGLSLPSQLTDLPSEPLLNHVQHTEQYRMNGLKNRSRTLQESSVKQRASSMVWHKGLVTDSHGEYEIWILQDHPCKAFPAQCLFLKSSVPI